MTSTMTRRLREARDQLISLRGQHEEAARTFEFPKIDGSFNWAHDWFDAVADGVSRDALVIVQEDGSRESVTFDDMRRRSNQLSHWLAERGMTRHTNVLLMLGNQIDLWVSMLAIMKLGAVIMPTTTAVGSADLVDRVRRGEASFVICNQADTYKFTEVPGDYVRVCSGESPGWANLREASRMSDGPVPHPATVAEDPLLLYFTSGTTNRPKLVRHTQVSYPVGHLSTLYWIGLEPGDVHLNISSPGWAKHAWSCFFAPWLAEATIFIFNYSRFDANALLAQLRGSSVTSLCVPPTVWRMLVQADLGLRPPALREILSAGEPLNPEVIDRVRRAWGMTIRDGFGQTEMTAAVGNTPGSAVKPGSMGRPLPGMPVVLVDPVSGAPVEGVGEGEICLDLARRPVSLMTGYLDDDERNAQAMAGGYYHTGDVACVDSDGYITYIGRTDDVFKASDYKISPFELESVLIEHPAVAEAAVVPAPDAIRLCVPKAYVALAPGFAPNAETAADILAFARTRLAPFQRIRRIEFFELPKTISGKIRRVELRQREAEHAGNLSAEFRDEQFPELRKLTVLP